VPVPSDENATVDLAECINESFSKELFEDYRCDGCKEKGTCSGVPTISRLPPYLILIMKRFDNSARKKRSKVNIDLNNTNLSKWISFPSVLKGISPIYTTFAVVEHHGVSRGGHYISYAKHNGTWIRYDDTSNSITTPDNIINNDTYILIMTNKQYASPTPVTKEIKPE
jgi:ubiquitin C-terminal hydrolase